MPLSTEVLRLTLEARLLQLLAQLGELPEEGCRVVTTFGNRTINLSLSGITPPPDPSAGRSDCERDCLQVLRDLGKPMTRVQIRAELERREKLWGESTVATALADLVAAGVLDNSRKRGGYFIPDQSS